MPTADAIKAKLKAALSPTFIEVIDESAAHAGHAGARPGGGSHFRVRIISQAFAGKSRLVRQRLVYDALSEEMASDLHALAISAAAPGEDAGGVSPKQG